MPLQLPAPSALSHLEGSASGERYDADVLQTTDVEDGRPLLARYDLATAATTLDREALARRRLGGMWRWSEILPLRDGAHVAWMGEGSTPLVPLPRVGAALGVRRMLAKAEGLNPTGAFKARGMAAAVSRAAELGVTSLIAPSAGNAGGALAAYGAAVGIDVSVLVPADTPQVNVDEALVCGARVLLVDGHIGDCGRLARAVAQRTGAFDLATLKEPYRAEGKKTMGLELVEDLGWRVPDVIVYPTGGGTGIVGMRKAFDELSAMGLLGAARPRFVSVQAEGCAPIVRAFESGAATAEPWIGAATRASGLRVPSAIGDALVLDALRVTGGTAVAVTEHDIDAVQRLVGRLGGGWCSPESAAAFAAVPLLRERGDIGADEEVVVFDTGIGHKYAPPSGLPVPSTVAADEDDVDRLVAVLGGASPLG